MAEKNRKFSKLSALLLLLLPVLAGFYLVSDYLMKPQEVPQSETEEVGEDVIERSISILPEAPIQGEPVLVSIEGVSGTLSVESFKFNGKDISFFDNEGKPSALIGIDLRMETGPYPIEVELSDGSKLEKDLVVSLRKIAQAPLGIPDKLGGNTPQSEQNLLNTLVEEGRIISAVPTSDEKLWSGAFRLPINAPVVVTDTYGYSRITGGSSISHKGTDFRAAIGTPIYAMNSGTVRLTREMRNYGKTVVIDHGKGLHTIYMHLSEIGVGLGEDVKKGQQIGKSGDTGYVLGPHLHLTVRINGISIDPEKFLDLFD